MLIQIILFDGFDLLDAIAPYEVLTAACDAAGGGIAVELVSVAGARAVPSGPTGLPIPAGGRPDLDRADVILIPGAAGPSGGDGPNTIPAILAREAAGEVPRIAAAALARPDRMVATICGGSLVLAMAGLLKGRPAVTHHLGMPLLEQAGAVPVKARVVDDGNLVTGGGVTSGLDVSLHLVDRLLGPRIAQAVEVLFEHERRGTVWRETGAAPVHTDQTAAVNREPPPSDLVPAPRDSGILGTWDVTIATPMGRQAVVYEFGVPDGVPIGTATQGAETTALGDLAVSGNRLTWTQHITKPMRLTLRFDATVEGDAMTGTAKAGVLPSSKLNGARRHGTGPAATQPAA